MSHGTPPGESLPFGEAQVLLCPAQVLAAAVAFPLLPDSQKHGQKSPLSFLVHVALVKRGSVAPFITKGSGKSGNVLLLIKYIKDMFGQLVDASFCTFLSTLLDI